MKSISTVLRNDAGEAIDLLCINQDVDALAGVLDQLGSLLGDPVPLAPVASLFKGDWRERINEAVGAFLAAENATIAGLTTPQMDALLAHLDKAHLFDVRNATPYIADILGMSRATIYNRLKRVRAAASRVAKDA